MAEATGLFKVAEVVKQLRGLAANYQVPDAQVGLAMAWRGVPTTSAAVVILSRS
jgi:acetyl-CoA acetyltransferase